jgi:hypothetical protein
MDKIEVTLTDKVALTPERIAELFWSMDCDEQADFFNHLDKVAGDRLCFQLQYVQDSSTLTDGGRHVMKMIGDYA